MNEIRLPVIYSKGYNVLTGTAELTKYLFFQGWLEGSLVLMTLLCPIQHFGGTTSRGEELS